MGRHTRRNEGATDMGEIRYMKVSRDFYEGLNALPEAQARKMLYACVGYFFTGECDLTGKLRQLFDFSQRANLDRYRTSVLNGMKNAARAVGGAPDSDEVFAETDAVSAKASQLLAKSDLEISPKTDAHHPTSPADTGNPGTTQTPTDGSGTIVIDKSKSKEIKKGGEPERLTLPSEDEWNQFIEDNELGDPYGDEYDRLRSRGWTDKRGRPVRDWKAYLLGISERVDDAHERAGSHTFYDPRSRIPPDEYKALTGEEPEYPF